MATCQCLYCRSRIARWARLRCYWLRARWHRYVGCPIYGHRVPGGWKHYCLRCFAGCPACGGKGLINAGTCPGTGFEKLAA